MMCAVWMAAGHGKVSAGIYTCEFFCTVQIYLQNVTSVLSSVLEGMLSRSRSYSTQTLECAELNSYCPASLS